MKSTCTLLLILAVFAMNSCKQATVDETLQSSAIELDYYQLQVYNYESKAQEILLDRYFGDALLPALHRAGIENVGVFKPIPELNETTNFMMVLVPFKSLAQFEMLPVLLEADPVYLESADDYINAAYDKSPYTRIESMILRSFTGTPKMALPELDSPKSERVYELRSYEAATEKLYNLKVEMFNEGESDIFLELDFNPVFFCEVLSSAHMPHLMYMTTHADTTAMKENWDAFGKHPEWERMKNLERYQNTVSSISRYLLYPTAYSDY